MNIKRTNRTYWGRTIIAIIAIVTLIKVWVGPITIPQEAMAQVPDSGKQRILLLEQAKRTNQLLAEIKQILAKDTLKVQWEGADKPSTDN